MSSERLLPGDITHMQQGGYRAECLVEYRDGRMCGWWEDSWNRIIAVRMLRNHMISQHAVPTQTLRGL